MTTATANVTVTAETAKVFAKCKWLDEFGGSNREILEKVCQLAESCHRNEDMAYAGLKLIECCRLTDGVLSKEERRLLSFGFRNISESRRLSWKAIYKIETSIEGCGKREEWTNNYRLTILEEEITEICQIILKNLDEVLLPNAISHEEKAHYFRLQGDYTRYLAEIAPQDNRQLLETESLTAYKKAWNISELQLAVYDLTRLGVGLNYGVFLCEILNDPDAAVEFCREVFDKALFSIDDLRNPEWKETLLVLQLIRDNLTLWRAIIDENAKKAEDEAKNME